MKKSFILCIAVLFMTSALLTAQASKWQWAKQAGGTGTIAGDYSYGISVDANGNSYITGGFYEPAATFGATTLTCIGWYDIFVAKLDKDGNWQWAKQAGGIGADYGLGISVDANGNSYVSGRFMGTATFGAFTLTSIGYNDIFVAKLDADGNWQWAKHAGGSDNAEGFCISIDAIGNSYVVGLFQGTATFGADTITSSGSDDIFVAKIDTDGNWQWAKQAGGSSYDQGKGIGVDANGNSYVTGYFGATATFGAFTITQSGGYDIFVAKIDTDGNWQWAKQAGGSSGVDDGRSIGVDANGNSYATGYFQGTATFGATTLTSSGSYEVFVAKLDTDGNWQWAKQAGGSGADTGSGINVDAIGNSYATGGFSGTATFGAFTLTSLGSYDIFVAKLDTDGNWQLAKQAGGSNTDSGKGIGVDANGNWYATGYFKETATFGTDTLTSVGDYDIFVAKLITQPIGDFNDDFYVGAIDLQMLGDHWHFVDTDPGWDAIYDLVVDGIIDAADLQVFGDHWHEGTPPKSGEGGKEGKGPNEFAGIVFDLDRVTYGNQNLTSIPSQPAGTYIPVDVYCTGVSNLDTYEFEVIYDPTELVFVSSSATNPINYEPNILTTNGGEALGWMVDNSTPGVLSIAYTLAGNDPAQAPEGEGLIADIVFQSLVDTYGTLTFGDVYYYDSYGVVDLITDTGTATLPVELSSFTAAYNTVSGFVSLCWATASETDVNGFNIYRNTEDSFVEADKININLIPGAGTTTEPTEYSFTDETADPYYTTYYYWLEVINFGCTPDVHGSFKYIPIDVNQDGELGIITSILSPCYPNPARIGNEIKFNFRVGGLEGTARNVELKVYNILGKLVAEVVNGERLVNDYTEIWRPDNLSNGVYFYQLKTDNYSEVKKMLLQ